MHALRRRWVGLLAKHRWIGFVAPLAVYMLLGQCEPHHASNNLQDTAPPDWFGVPAKAAYPVYYATRLGLVILAMLAALPVYVGFPRRISPLSVLVGAVGAVIWIGVCRLGWEQAALAAVGWVDSTELSGRAAYNPLAELQGAPFGLAAFLAVRFLGLVVVVPIIEEFFLRGFVMRWAVDPDRWWKLPIGAATAASIAAGTAYGMLAHPGELLAAGLWFSLITWLMIKTRSLWDCVLAHAVTNLLLGCWVLAVGDWRLW